MSKMHCDIVKDLLPLYVEDVCSEKSKAEIEEHLKECETCSAYYETLKEEPEVQMDDVTTGNLFEGAFILGIEQKIQKKITANRVVAGFVVLLICIIGTAVCLNLPQKMGYGFGAFVDQRLDVEDVTITEIYQLESGEIFFTAKSDQEFTWPYTDTALYDEGKDCYYSCGMYTYSWWDDHIKGNGTLEEASFIYSPIARDVTGRSYEVSELRFVGKDDESILVWEKGQELEPAPKEIEEEAKELHVYSEDERGGICIFTERALETLE